MSPLPEDEVTAVHAWCDARVPAHARDQVLVECEVTDRHLTIVERRVPYWADHPDRRGQAPEAEWTRLPVARLRFVRTSREWTLYWRDRNLHFHRHDRVPPAAKATELLQAIDRDTSGIFWG